MIQNNEFTITRVLDAPCELVWKAHTEADRLLQWWGPKGLKMIAAELDLRPGGVFLYGMETPDGEQMWGKFVYREIIPQEKLVFVVSFSDANGGITRHPMSDTWPLEVLNTITFKEHNGQTTMTVSGHPINASSEEQATFDGAHAGMNQGFNGTYDQLAAYLSEVTV